jgi:GntR family transcriptional regulator
VSETTDSRPLYAQVRETLIERIRAGLWQPGQLIPNEFDIAAEFKVSQGTARKAIDMLAADGLVVRRQGKGTYVAENTPADVLFRFFHVYDAQGRQLLPECAGVPPRTRRASDDERRILRLTEGAEVITIERTRTVGGRPFSLEHIVLPAALFPTLVTAAAIPNTLYDLFQKSHGVLVARADDRLGVILAGPAEQAALGVSAGTPLLRIDRTAFDLDGRPVEWRISLCHLEGAHYLARVG